MTTKAHSWLPSFQGSLLDGTTEIRFQQRTYGRLSKPVLVFLAFSACVAFWWEFLSGSGSTGVYNANDVFNRTLGFERNFVISMPSRTDRHDTFALAAAYAEFDFELFDGVDADRIATKALPVTWNKTLHPMGRLGCWRANMDVLQKIVREKIQTAIIFQDDADWDITIKQQLAQHARAIRTLQGSTKHTDRISPYGNAWDVLWLGHASVAPPYEKTQVYVIEDDPTVPPLARRHGLFMSQKLPTEVLSNNTRLVFQVKHSSWGLAAYGITYEGARKVLAALSLSPNNEATDLNFSTLCGGGMGMSFMCYAAYPTLIGVYRPEGPSSRDSEIRNFDKSWHKSYSFDIVYSVKQNLLRIARGDNTVAAQWPKEVHTSRRTINERLVTGKEYVKEFKLGEEKEKWVAGVNGFRTLEGGVAWEQGKEVEEAIDSP